MVFRVYQGSVTVPKALSIVGADAQLGALVPNTIAMHDDGTGGDQKAGDGVWTYTAALTPLKSVSYVYTNSGTAGQWEGLDVPHIRRAEVPPATDGRPVYLPIETFGRVYMQGDDWHTDAVGYDAIALPIAAGVFEPSIGLVLRPEIAALSMSGSSLLVAVNALLLKTLKLPAPEL